MNKDTVFPKRNDLCCGAATSSPDTLLKMSSSDDDVSPCAAAAPALGRASPPLHRSRIAAEDTPPRPRKAVKANGSAPGSLDAAEKMSGMAPNAPSDYSLECLVAYRDDVDGDLRALHMEHVPIANLTQEALGHAYRAVLLLVHPDKCHSPYANAAFRRVKAAADRLKPIVDHEQRVRALQRYVDSPPPSQPSPSPAAPSPPANSTSGVFCGACGEVGSHFAPNCWTSKHSIRLVIAKLSTLCSCGKCGLSHVVGEKMAFVRQVGFVRLTCAARMLAAADSCSVDALADNLSDELHTETRALASDLLRCPSNIMIIACPGAGKTTLATAVGRALTYKCVSLPPLSSLSCSLPLFSLSLSPSFSLTLSPPSPLSPLSPSLSDPPSPL
jgi:hypothetical protein